MKITQVVFFTLFMHITSTAHAAELTSDASTAHAAELTSDVLKGLLPDIKVCMHLKYLVNGLSSMKMTRPAAPVLDTRLRILSLRPFGRMVLHRHIIQCKARLLALKLHMSASDPL
jgi:hypothetical protein